MIKSLEDLPGIRKNVKLAPYTTWKIGGPATYFWEPTTDLIESAISYCKKNSIMVYYLGRGSNVLINDKGLDGLVICTKRVMQNILFQENIVEVEAGVPMPKLSKMVARRGYGGFEFLIGIPGTVGAGVAINAGLASKTRVEIMDQLIKVEVIDNIGQLRTIKKENLKMRYRGSIILDNNWFVLKAYFNLNDKSTQDEIKYKTLENLKNRKSKQPLSKATAGSVFKKIEGGNAAGWYIDQAGLKGYQIGGAKISEKHANWIENVGKASSKDVLSLIDKVKTIISNKFNVDLQSEITILE